LSVLILIRSRIVFSGVYQNVNRADVLGSGIGRRLAKSADPKGALAP
jgi:hypothetical protein